MSDRAGKMQLVASFNAKEQHAQLQINEGPRAWAHVTLELPEFIAFVQGMGRLRQQFAEPVAAELDAGSRVEAVVDPAWRVMDLTQGLPAGSATLLLRHPGFGWLGFALPQHEARALGEALLRAANGQPPDTDAS